MPYLKSFNVDILCVQETWLRKSDGAKIELIKEYGFKVFLARKSRKIDLGGGVAVIFPNNRAVKLIRSENYKSFEHVVCKVSTLTGHVILINIYRPDYSEKNRYTVKDFLHEFKLLLESFAANGCPIVIVGDLNLHYISCLA